MGLIERVKDLFLRLFSPHYDDYSVEEDELPRYHRERLPDDFDADSRQVRRDNIVSVRTTTQVRVVLVKPTRFENASEISDHLLSRRTVVLNLEGLETGVARRLVDFLSGVVYVREGAIKKVAPNTYFASPYDIDIMGSLIGELEDSGVIF